MTNWLSTLIGKVSKQQVVDAIKGYLYIYLHPIKAWRKAFEQDNHGYNFTILHVLYYTILVFIATQDVSLTFLLVILEVILTFIPFISLLPSFKLMTSLLKKPKKWIYLFRILLIIKFQFIPLFLLLYLVIYFLRVEKLFVLIGNYPFLIILVMLLSVPIIMPVRATLKAVFFLSNYISYIIVSGLLILIFFSLDQEGIIIDKISPPSPIKEYVNIIEMEEGVRSSIDNSYFLIKTIRTDSQFLMHKPIIPENGLVYLTLISSMEEMIKEQNEIDSLLSLLDSSYVRKSYSGSDFYKKLPFIFNEDALRIISANLEDKMEKDLKIFDSYKDSAVFATNRKLALHSHRFLLDINKIREVKNVYPIMTSQKLIATYSLNDTASLLLYKLEAPYIENSNKIKMKQIENQTIEQMDGEILLAELFLYPLIILTEN